MREIKFRAWDKIKNQMSEVRVIDWLNGMVDLPYLYIKRYWSNNSNNDEVILMQYTGLKDKNGKEIYEGDIVHGVRYCDDRLIETTGKVIWSYCELMIEDERGTYDPFLNYYEDFYINELSEIEVVGNIYENLELIKEEKE